MRNDVEIIVAPDAGSVAVMAADLVTDVVRGRADAVLGLATGSSPQGLYAELAARVAAGFEMGSVRAFALDEYVGLAPTDPRSYTHVIRTMVTEPCRLDPDLVHVPPGTAADLAGACADFETAITAAGGVDLQILGIGRNGHLGFNEPLSSFDSRTRVAVLSESTRRDNARFFDSIAQVPTHCVTQGLATIMAARSALLIATGAAKADALLRAVAGPVSEQCPASLLQLHDHVVVIADTPAAARLAEVDRRGLPDPVR